MNYTAYLTLALTACAFYPHNSYSMLRKSSKDNIAHESAKKINELRFALENGLNERKDGSLKSAQIEYLYPNSKAYMVGYLAAAATTKNPDPEHIIVDNAFKRLRHIHTVIGAIENDTSQCNPTPDDLRATFFQHLLQAEKKKKKDPFEVAKINTISSILAAHENPISKVTSHSTMLGATIDIESDEDE